MFRDISLLLDHPNALDPNAEESAIDFTWIEFDPDIGYPRSYTTTYNKTTILPLISVDVRVLK
jgi:hypothetical protein